MILDIAILWDLIVASKENERIEKYRPLKDETARMQGVGKVVIIPVAALYQKQSQTGFKSLLKKLKQIKGLTSSTKQC